MVSSEHYRRVISSASISAGFFIEISASWQPAALKGANEGWGQLLPLLAEQRICREEAFSGNRKGCPYVTFREGERKGT